VCSASGGTNCTLTQCKAKCSTYSNFTCTAYAHDGKEGDCYVFKECVDEEDEADYNMYVMVDPTCEKNMTGRATLLAGALFTLCSPPELFM
jgi:hypothetical protein